MKGFRRFNYSARKKVLDLLDTSNLRMEVAVERITVVQFGLNNGGVNCYRLFWNI